MNEDKKTYIGILIDTLKKKLRILKDLTTLTEQQAKILDSEEVDVDAFEAVFPKKEALLNELQRTDKGFNDIYMKVQAELHVNKQEYKKEIADLQMLITMVTDLGVGLQSLEQSNRTKFEMYLSSRKKELKNFKISNKTAASYYSNMTGHHKGDSYFMDKRK